MVPEGLTAMGSLDETAGKIKMGEFEWPTEHGRRVPVDPRGRFLKGTIVSGPTLCPLAG